MQPLVNYFNHRQISHFQTCWVPAPDGLLTPDLLQHPSSIQPVFIGFLSRLSIPPLPIKYKVLALLSGPSPQREQLGEILKKQLRELDIPAGLIWGDFSGEQITTTDGNLTEMNFADAEQLNQLIGASEIVVARSGYSTVMDLIGSQKKAIFVPTPGQTEQEYLANIMHKKKIAITAPQHNFDLKADIDATAPTSGFISKDFTSIHLLQQAIQQL
jgi:UDP-N-acetylglucosamine transferase subunit ALG13